MIIKTPAQIDEAFDKLAPYLNRFLSIDIETDGLKKTSNIYGIGIGVSENEAFYFALKNPDGSDIFDESVLSVLKHNLRYLLTNSKLIGHNLVYDLYYLNKWLEASLENFVAYDTILLRHLINENGPFGLKELAEIEFGKSSTLPQERLFQSVLANGGKLLKSEAEYFKADTDVLGEYCKQDTILSLKLFNKYLPIVKKEGLEDLLETEVMPLYREVTIPMNHRGIRVDVKELHRIRESIKEDIQKLEDDLMKNLAPLVSEFETKLLEEEVKVSKRGAFIKELCKELGIPEATKAFYKKFTSQNQKQQLLVDIILDKEDEAKLKEFEETPLIQRRIFFEKFPDQRYIFNLRSKHHLRWLFFEKLNLEPISETETGMPKVDDSFLDHVVENNSDLQFISKLHVLNKLEKLRGTYIEGILERIEFDEFIFPSMLQHGTTSGRFASRNPNVQNLPRPKEDDSEDPLVVHYTNQIRKIFISREGYVFVDADYSALEPRCFSHCSGDEKLQHIFKSGEDMYSSLAINVFGVKDASPFKKDGDNFLGKKYPELRQKMKVVSLAAVYGASEFRIAKLLKTEVEEAKEILDNYMDSYPKLKQYIERCHKGAKELGYVTTEFGRRRHLMRAKVLWSVNKKFLSDPVTAKKHGMDEEYWELKNLLNNSTNFPIQGLAAHLVNRAMININRQLRKEGIDGLVVLQVHDQIVVECKKEFAERCVDIVRYSMENVAKLSVPLIAEPKIAENLKDSH